ncbi:hypothetical protein [Puerhibacterium sp. TATVAM-FAB25]|uniref:hypothetical protein n=1 Tax=Puerhibacterium sp. TATVAM-FAB25 TaxID=3093699 RepID=UPI00397D3DEB
MARVSSERGAAGGRPVRSVRLFGNFATMSIPPAVFFVAYVVPRLRSWGTTPSERSRRWPGDDLVPRPGFVWTNAITVHRPADQVWPWVTQLGQGRAGLYSYDWLENMVGADVHSSAEVRADLQEPLGVGRRVVRMARYAPANPVAGYDPGRALVLGGVGDSDEQLHDGRPSSTWAFVVEPAGPMRSRLVVRCRGGGVVPRLQGPVQIVMQRRTMEGIRQRAEGTWAPSVGDVLVPASWFLGAAAAAALAARALTDRRRAVSPFAPLAALAADAVQVLVFGDLSARGRTALVLALGCAAAPRRTVR